MAPSDGTVADETETQTGFQKRRPERQIGAGQLYACLATAHPVADRERAERAARVSDIAFDRGEASPSLDAVRDHETFFDYAHLGSSSVHARFNLQRS